GLLRLRAGGRLDPFVIEPHRLLDVAREYLLRRQVREPGDPAELAHRLLADLASLEDQRALPESEGAVLLERGHTAEHPLVLEVREAPLHRLLHVRAGRVDDLPQVVENWPGELGGFLNVGIDPRISYSHTYSPIRNGPRERRGAAGTLPKYYARAAHHRG